MSNRHTASADALHTFITSVLHKAGMLPDQAATAADVLMYASRRGVDTHGIRNLLPIYVKEIEEKRVNLRPTYKIEHETPISARVDGDEGNGLVAATWAMKLAMEKARQSGMGMVAVNNSRHYGAAGYYTWLTGQHDMIGISMTGRFYANERDYGVPPTFGASAKFSTNPLAFSFPTDKEPLWNFDMATSLIPFNRVTMMRDAGQTLPPGWALDANMQPTTDPVLARFVPPLGGSREMGGHKGYGLAMMVSAFCNVLSNGWNQLQDNNPDSFEGYQMRGDGHFLAAMRVDLFNSLDDFKKGMDAMIRSLHQSPKLPSHDRIYVAGEIEHETEIKRLAEGVPLPKQVVADVKYLSEKYGVEL